MAGAPITGDNNSDHHPIHYDSTNPSDLIFPQFASPKTSNPNPPPVTASLGKRRKSKPVRYVENTNSPNTVVEDSSNKRVKSAGGSLAVMNRAREVQSSLGTEHPTCVKEMVKAHVEAGYWMGFPQWFGKMFLPEAESEMEIEDEKGEIDVIRYNADKSGLSAGWKKFTVGHNLVEGDVLVFQLVQPFKFKVYIIRANEADGAHGLITFEAQTIQKKRKLSSPQSQISSHLMYQSGNDSEEVASEFLEASKPLKPDPTFQEVKAFEDFHIMVKGTCIDSELPDDVRMSYYNLCISRKEYLHDALPESMYSLLITGMIYETVNIANEIKNCKITTTKQEFAVWDNSLKSFGMLGMKVGFLRDRIGKLSGLVLESEGCLDIQKYVEAKNEQNRIEDEISRLDLKLVELKQTSRRLLGIVNGMKQKVAVYEEKFQEEVDAPWF